MVDIEKCAVCGEKGRFADGFHFIPTCETHREHGNVYTVEVLKHKLGIISKEELNKFLSKCQICECNLTQEEKDKVSEFDTIITCNQHSEARKWYQIDLSRLWFIFKGDNVSVSYDDEGQRRKFFEWRHEMGEKFREDPEYHNQECVDKSFVEFCRAKTNSSGK